MATITWTDKTDATVSGLAESQKVTASTTAEIKSVVNTNMGLITTNANDIFSLEERSGTTPASFDYLSATTASDPGSGKFKLNHTAIELATHIYISSTEEFRDISSLLDTLAVDSVIYIQDRVSPANSGVFKVVSFVDNTTWYDITMTVESVSLAFSTFNFYSFSVFTKATTGIGTGTVTSVIAGAGMTQSGTSTIDPTIDIIAGDGILVNANNVEIDYDGADNFIEVATGLEGTDIDPDDTLTYSDDDDKIVKRGLVSDLPFADDFTPDAPITLAAGLLGHMNTDGSKHVPANSTTNDGNVLTSSGIAGDYVWKTPSTLPTLTTRTGSTLVFDAYAEYNAVTPVTSGNITINPSGAVAGAYVGFYINSATEPTISGAVGQVESGTFATSQINIFHFFWNTNGKYVLNIQNEAVAQTQLTTPTVAAVAGDTLIDLTFSSIDSNATLNILDVSTDDITYVNEAGYDGTSLTYQDTGLTNGQIYYYRLKSQASGYTDSAYGTDDATPAAAATALVFTLSNMTESPAGKYQNTFGTPYDGFGVTTTAIATGDFTFVVSLKDSDSDGCMFGMSQTATVRKWNDATPWEFISWISLATDALNIGVNGSSGTIDTATTVAYSSGNTLKLTRSGSNLKLYYNDVEKHDFGTISTNDMYLHISASNTLYCQDPEI